MGKRKIKIPTETFDNDTLKGITRKYPSLDCLKPQEIKLLDSRVKKLMDFESKARIPHHVVDYLSSWLSKRSNFREHALRMDIGENSLKRKYFFRDPWEGSSIAIIKEGLEPITEGFNLVLCHSDSPCLMLKPKPVRLEWSKGEIYNFLGMRLSGTAYGGLSVHHWVGQQVMIIGYVINKKGERARIEIPGVIGDYASHVDYRGNEEVNEAFKREKSFEIIPGYANLEETLNRFGIETLDDFSDSRLFAVPTVPPLPIDEYTWRLLVAYGHDDRVCTFAATDAIIKAKNPKKTAIVWVTDKEEIGDTSPTGASGPFLDMVLDYLLKKEKLRPGIKTSEKNKADIYYRSSLLIGDVEVAPYGHDSEEMDVSNAPKIGGGVYISTDQSRVSDPFFVRKLRNLVRRGHTLNRNIIHQPSGKIYNQDREELWYHHSDGKENLTSKVGQWAWVGIPCASMHSHNEIICPADEMWASKLYKRFFESDLGLR